MSLGAAQLQSSQAKADQTVDATLPFGNRLLMVLWPLFYDFFTNWTGNLLCPSVELNS